MSGIWIDFTSSPARLKSTHIENITDPAAIGRVRRHSSVR